MAQSTATPLDDLAPEESDLWVESPKVVWRSLAALFCAGAVIGALSLLLPHPASYDEAWLWSNVILALLATPALWFAPRFLPLWSVQIFVAIGTIVITQRATLSELAWIWSRTPA
jgi:hypothetical protein